MNVQPIGLEGYNLLHNGVLALSRMEANGLRVDVGYMERTVKELIETEGRMTEEFKRSEVGRAWQKKFGEKTKLGARQQLKDILFMPSKFGGLGFPPPEETTESGDESSANEAALEALNLPEVSNWLRIQKYQRARTAYLNGTLREVVGDRVHPFFHLHTAKTFRSSCDKPPFHQMPVRDVEIAKLVRRGVIASPGCVLVENDFKGVEIGVSACYNKDPKLIEYVKDETLDMHRDISMELFFLTQKQVSKATRHVGKNKFIFPQFYGDWWYICSRSIWEDMERRHLEVDGVPMRDHLLKHGIDRLGDWRPPPEGQKWSKDDPGPAPGTFQRHVKDVERKFWYERFAVYTEWKKSWHAAYLANGFFDTYTGFRIGGMMGKNQVINYPVQGSAFHCLLWALVRIQRELSARGMKSKLVRQIHDSIIADVPVEELDDYLEIVHRIITVDLPRHWSWIIVPLVVELEIVPEGMTWFDKREVKMKPGAYETKDGKFRGSARDLLRYWRDIDGKN